MKISSVPILLFVAIAPVVTCETTLLRGVAPVTLPIDYNDEAEEHFYSFKADYNEKEGKCLLKYKTDMDHGWTKVDHDKFEIFLDNAKKGRELRRIAEDDDDDEDDGEKHRRSRGDEDSEDWGDYGRPNTKITVEYSERTGKCALKYKANDDPDGKTKKIKVGNAEFLPEHDGDVVYCHERIKPPDSFFLEPFVLQHGEKGAKWEKKNGGTRKTVYWKFEILPEYTTNIWVEKDPEDTGDDDDDDKTTEETTTEETTTEETTTEETTTEPTTPTTVKTTTTTTQKPQPTTPGTCDCCNLCVFTTQSP